MSQSSVTGTPQTPKPKKSKLTAGERLVRDLQANAGSSVAAVGGVVVGLRKRTQDNDEQLEASEGRYRHDAKREYNRKFKPIVTDAWLSTHLDKNVTIRIFADGACRNNGTTSAQSSFGVFVDSFSSGLTGGQKLNSNTNNAAEIQSGCGALQVVFTLAAAGFTNFEINMDSFHVVSGVLSGRAAQSTPNARLINNTEWCLLQSLLTDLPNGISLTWRWIPRALNAMADECANAMLDSRPFNEELVIPTSIGMSTLHARMEQAITRHTTQLPRMSRHIPFALQDLVVDTFSSLANHFDTRQQLVDLMLIFPALCFVFHSQVQNRDTFRHLRVHLHLLRDPVYMGDCLLHLIHAPPQVFKARKEQSEEDIFNRNMSLAKCGALHKICQTSDSYIDTSREAADDLADYFPEVPLPQPLPDVPFKPLVFGEILRAFKKLKRHKGGGMSGWTREFLAPFFKRCVTNKLLCQKIVDIFNTITESTQLTKVQSQFLRSPMLMVLRYKSQVSKKRPLIMFDPLCKIAWHCALLDILDPVLQQSAHLYGLKFQCQSALHAIQSALDDGIPVVRFDAQRAFPTVARDNAFKHFAKFQGTYSQVFGLLNLFYSNPVMVQHFYNGVLNKVYVQTTGCMQGCVSGPFFYTMATLDVSIKHRSRMVQVADDIHLVTRESLFCAEEVVTDFMAISQRLLGSKTKIICKHRDFLVPPILANVEIVNTPIVILGGFVVPNPPPQVLFSAEPDALALPEVKNILERIKNKYASILSALTSSQIKFLLLRAVSWDVLYYSETWPSIISKPFFRVIDELQISTLCKICDISVAEIDPARVHSPVESGGLGILPWSELHEYLFNRSQVSAFRVCQQRGLPHVSTPPTDFSLSISNLWINLFKDSMSACSRTAHMGLNDRMYLANSGFVSWLRAMPSSPATTLTDDQFKTAIRLNLSILTPIQHLCTMKNIQLQSLTPAEFTQHYLNCHSCAGTHWIPRHQLALFALKSALGFNCLYSQIPKPTEFPLPGKTKGGFDLFLSADQLYGVDVKVCNEATIEDQTSRNLAVIFKRCTTWYEKFKNQTSIVTAPFVLSIFGIVSPETMTLVNTWSQLASDPARCRFDVCTNPQFAVYRALHDGLQKLSFKNICFESVFADAVENNIV